MITPSFVRLAVILSCSFCVAVPAMRTSFTNDTKHAPLVSGKANNDISTKSENTQQQPEETEVKSTVDNAIPGENKNIRTALRITEDTPTGFKNGNDGHPTTTQNAPNNKGVPSRPHIMMIVADDLGWNDVGWRDKTMYTPVLTGLASQGVVLNKAYVQPVCSPSRAAFMSGFYPYHLGMQHKSLRASQKAHLPDNLTTLPQHLKKLGYKTHMAGKWHLGFCNWRYTPTYRGFDSFVGFYNAIEDYYTHMGHWNGYDFRENKDVYSAANGTYSAFIFTQHIEQVIANHDVSEPLFVYLPYQSVHGPLQVPQHYIDKYCSHIHNETRRTHCGMAAALDEGVGNVTRALQEKGMFKDTILLFTTDNGGPVHEGANNWPLRGSKTTLWEGGTRGTAFLHGPKFFPNSGKTYDGMIHAVDWLPTLVEAAGGPTVTGLDGVSQWQSIVQSKVPSARTEFVYNFDELKQNSAIRQGKFKLLEGNPGSPSGWYPPPTMDNGETARYLDIPELKDDDSWNSSDKYVAFGSTNNADHLTYNGDPVVRMTSEGDKKQYQMYDLETDPYERNDVKAKYPGVFKQMVARMEEYRKSLVPANFPPDDPDSHPSHYNGAWTPGWC